MTPSHGTSSHTLDSRTQGRILWSASALVALAVVSGCAGPPVSSSTGAGSPTSSTPPAATGSPYPTGTATESPVVPIAALGGVDDTSIDAVALAGLRAIESADTSIDADPHAAVERAAAWLTPQFAAQVRAYPPAAAPGAGWSEWVAHRAYLTVTTSLAGDDHPPDTAAAAARQVIAVLTPVGRDGWTSPPITTVVFVALARLDGHWRVASAQAT